MNYKRPDVGKKKMSSETATPQSVADVIRSFAEKNVLIVVVMVTVFVLFPILYFSFNGCGGEHKQGSSAAHAS